MKLQILPAVKELKIEKGMLGKCTVSYQQRKYDRRIERALSYLHSDENGIPIVIEYELGDKEAYQIQISEEEIKIQANDERGAFYAVQTLRQVFSYDEIPCLYIYDKTDFSYRGFYQDVSRGKIPTVETMKWLIEQMAYFKMNSLQLYVEHVFEFEECRNLNPISGYYSKEELQEIEEYCQEHFIEFIPSLAVFGHMFDILNQEKYRHLCVLKDYHPKSNVWRERMLHHVIDPVMTESELLVKHLLEQYEPLFKSDKFNICCDETFDLSRHESKENPGKLYVDFVTKIISHIKNKDKRVMMWSDVLLQHPEYVRYIPKDTFFLTWDYSANPSEENISKLEELGVIQIVCPGTASWSRLSENFSIEESNITKMAEYGYRHGAEGILLTNWGDWGNPCSLEMSMYGLVLAACKAWNVSSQIDECFWQAVNHLLYQKEQALDYVRALSELEQDISWSKLVDNYYHSCGDDSGYRRFVSSESVKKIQRTSQKLIVELKEQIWNQDEYRQELLIALEGVCLIAELNAKLSGIECERLTDTYVWIEKYSQKWLQKNKTSELATITKVLLDCENRKVPLKHGAWIWSNSEPGTDEYAEFVDDFEYKDGEALLHISADSNYAVYLNGELAAWGQYSDFPYDKVYDTVAVTKYCKKGYNRIAILVWYYGIDTTSVYYPGNAGLIYEVSCGEKILCTSDENTLSRKSKAYISHRNKQITCQLGLGYGYDATKEDDWITGDLIGFSKSVIVEQNPSLRIRPCNKLILLPEVTGALCKKVTDTDVIFDLGSEQVGFLALNIDSACEQNLLISYGEHLASGCVRQKIGARDFSISYRAKKGNNAFLNPFRRLGCRYLEVHSEVPLVIKKVALAPTMYPLMEGDRPHLQEKQNRIYDICVETLRLCMHEHYEDCPWREQALYAMDSRNQMLCGYYAFGEYQFPRANLELISKDNRKDGLLSICYPMKWDYTIPSFSLHYIIECKEYLEYSRDKEFLEEIYQKLVSIIGAFTNHMQDGLVQPFIGENYWNFYEWRDGLDGETQRTEMPDLILNALFSFALQNMAVIADALKKDHIYLEQAKELNWQIRATFWNEQEKVFCNLPELQAYSQLGNSLAVLCGVTEGEEAKELCERIRTDKRMTPISLPMKCFQYDAWLKVSKADYTSVILEDIDKVYSPMLAAGGSTVWETELGESDFQGAGSLCHGWSAFPIYYYHILMQ